MSDNITNTNTNINTTGDQTMKKCHKCGEEFEAEEERASINCDDCGFDCGDENCKDCREWHDEKNGCERCGNAQCSGKDCWEACSVCGEDMVEHNDYGGKAEECYLANNKDDEEEEKCEKCGGTHCLNDDYPCDETCPENCCNKPKSIAEYERAGDEFGAYIMAKREAEGK